MVSEMPFAVASAFDPGRCVTSRSEEHTSELQSQSNLVCRLLLEKKKKHSFCHRITMGTTPIYRRRRMHALSHCDHLSTAPASDVTTCAHEALTSLVHADS